MLRFIILTIAAAATASVTHDGPCPDIKPVANFNVTANDRDGKSSLIFPIAWHPTGLRIRVQAVQGSQKETKKRTLRFITAQPISHCMYLYQGTWYEIQKFPIESEKDGKCASAEYVVDGDTVKVTNRHVVGNVQAVVTGTAKLADDANNAGKLVVALHFGAVTREQPLHVIATDYTNYAIAYNCKNDDNKKTHQDNMWILSRTKKLEGEAKTAVDNFLKEHAKDFDTSKLITTDFSEAACKFDSTTTVKEPAKH